MKKVIIVNMLLILSLNILPKEVKVEAKEEIIIEQTISSRSLEEPRKEHIVADNEMLVESDKCQSKPTEISQEGIDLIKRFEGLRLQAYKLDGEKFWTIRIWNT